MRSKFILAALVSAGVLGTGAMAIAQSAIGGSPSGEPGTGAAGTGAGTAPPSISTGITPPAGSEYTGMGTIDGLSINPATGQTSPGTSINGMGTTGIDEPGAPNISIPGAIGTNALPSGLANENPNAPGFPGSLGTGQN